MAEARAKRIEPDDGFTRSQDEVARPREDLPQDEDVRFPLARPPLRAGRLQRLIRAPLLRLLLYYVAVLLVGIALIDAFHPAREALVSPSFPALAEGAEVLSGERPSPEMVSPAIPAGSERALTTLFVVLGAIVLALPVAWVYMWSKRLRFDPGLVRSVIILPIAVAGILLVVKNSLAIAFSLAGIVAAVRFRNTLKDPQDAVYVFLAIAIGIAAGVQALDVALVVSFVFNLAVLAMWKFQVGSVYAGNYGRTGVLSIGDSALLVAQNPDACRALRRQVLRKAADMEADGVLLVHSTDSDMARQTVQDALSQTTQDWRLLGIYPRGEGVQTAEYLVRLERNTTSADLIGTLDDWAAQIEAAEYVPYRRRARPRQDGESELRPT